MRHMIEAAKGLTRNPLGIIGLFVVLVYGFACLVLGLGCNNMPAEDRRILVIFIVLFPLAILAVFFRLVTAHHSKLYAPSDYKDERLFLSPLSDKQRTQRLDSEVKYIIQQEATQSTQSSEQPAPRSTPAVRSAYADAERLAFLELENEIGKPFQKYVQVSSHGKKEQFDGVLITDTEAYLIDIKYFSRPAFKREFLEALIHRASTFIWDQTVDSKPRKDNVVFWIALVVDFAKEALPEFQRKVEDAVRCDMFPVKVRIYHIDDLREKYG